MGLRHAEVVEVLKIIDEFGVGELRLEYGGLKVRVIKGTAAAAAAPEPAARFAAGATSSAAPTPGDNALATAAEAPPVAASGLVPIVAPMIGTFYHAPAPGAPPFVEPGQLIEPDTPIGIIDLMKLMNTISAGVRGRVRDIRAPNATFVEYGQVLMYVEPEDR